MFVRPSPVISDFVNALSLHLKEIKASAQFTSKQTFILSLVLTGIFVEGTINWAAFERKGLHTIKNRTFSWFLHRAKIAWDLLLQASLRHVFQHYQITQGILSIDDTDKARSKRTRVIAGAHKIKHKPTGGYLNGQELVFMVLITDAITIPVGFQFYQPDPAWTAWRKENKRLKKKGVPKQDRPKCPKKNTVDYPSKIDLALRLLTLFVRAFPDIKIKGVLADALYGTGQFMEEAARLTHNAQIVSQLRCNQCVSSKNSKASLKAYFSRQPGVTKTITIRGGQQQTVVMLAARLYVKAHKARRYVVALKYEGETDYRYLVASNLSWRQDDIAQFYTLRWLIEVFIQDWKTHGGWNRLSKHQGESGSTHGVILSLLSEHALLLHPEQSTRFKQKQPGLSAGCVVERLRTEALIDVIREMVTSENPIEMFNQFHQEVVNSLPTRDSSKHMGGRDLGRQDATESLKYQSCVA